jgi:hypothetical protein
VPGLAGRTLLVVYFSISLIGSGGFRRGCRYAEQHAAQNQLPSPSPVRQKAELPDAHESTGQHVKEKAPDELDRVQRHDLGLVAVRVILPQEGDLAAFDRQDPAVGDR